MGLIKLTHYTRLINIHGGVEGTMTITHIEHI